MITIYGEGLVRDHFVMFEIGGNAHLVYKGDHLEAHFFVII